jgi:hypothetical protein
VCAEIESPGLTVVVSSDSEARSALLDVLSARVIPDEGRAWVDCVPLMRETRHRLRARVVDVDAGVLLGGRRSDAWQALRGRYGAGQLRYLVVRELDDGLRPSDLIASVRQLRPLAEGVSVLVSVARCGSLLSVADRLLAIEDGRLVFDGPPASAAGRALVLR